MKQDKLVLLAILQSPEWHVDGEVGENHDPQDQVEHGSQLEECAVVPGPALRQHVVPIPRTEVCDSYGQQDDRDREEHEP